MSVQQKFDAAVNVIQSLPKSGEYQPSNDMMLKFYSYFKQAREGKCKIKKPAFWDVVGRAKWDAWNSLGDMPSAKAMELYVSELQKIIETMAYTGNVSAFCETVDELPSNMSKEDLEMIAGDILRKFRPSSSSTESSQDNSPLRSTVERVVAEQNGHYDSDDEFIDTVESADAEVPVHHVNGFIPNGHAMVLGHETVMYNRSTIDKNLLIIEELKGLVSRLEHDIASLKQRFQTLEREQANQEDSILWMRPAWWPIRRVSPAVLVIFFLWPIVANKMMAALRSRRKP